MAKPLDPRIAAILKEYDLNPKDAMWDCHGTWVMYHRYCEINAEVAADTLAAEITDLAAGYAPRRWICDCGASHSRGHFMTIGVHRCMGCGYIGTSGVMVDP